MNIKLLGIFTCTLFMLFTTSLSAQSTQVDANSVVLTKADIFYKMFNYSQASKYYEEYLTVKTNSNTQLVLKLADCYWNMRQYDKAFNQYLNLQNYNDLQITDQVKVRIAELHARNKDYQKASEFLSDIVGYKQKATAYSKQAAMKAMVKDSLNWKVKLLNINTKHREFSPVVLGNFLMFASNKPVGVITPASGWDGNNFIRLWSIPLNRLDTLMHDSIPNAKNSISPKQNKGSKRIADVYECGDTKSTSNINRTLVKKTYLQPATSLIGDLVDGAELHKYNSGNIAVDKNNKLYMSSNYDKPDKYSVNRIQIVQADYERGVISKIKKLPFGNPSIYSVMHPAVTNDGQILVFSSDKPNGVGKFDLYYSEWNKIEKKWKEMQPLSNKINTAGNEVFPTITSNGILYFSSDALQGLGGLDIFKISLNDAISGNAEAQHLSYPINSSSDDFGWTQKDSLGKVGFITSDRLNFDDNIYSFNYIESPKPTGKYTLNGFVMDEVDKKPIEDATVFMYNKQTGKVLVAKTDKNGRYSYSLPSSVDVVLKAVEKNHSDKCFSTQFYVKPIFKDTVVSTPNLVLGRFSVGFKWKLENIYYDYNKFFIRNEAKATLDLVYNILVAYPIIVELGSHTDSRGTVAYNAKLAQNRANAAVEYLISKGISKDRITAKGYGDSQLTNRCARGVKCSDAEHQANRRTEIKVISLTDEGEKLQIDPSKFSAGQELDKLDLPLGFFDKCR